MDECVFISSAVSPQGWPWPLCAVPLVLLHRGPLKPWLINFQLHSQASQIHNLCPWDPCLYKLRNAFGESPTYMQKDRWLAWVIFHILNGTAAASCSRDQTPPHPSCSPARFLSFFHFLRSLHTYHPPFLPLSLTKTSLHLRTSLSAPLPLCRQIEWVWLVGELKKCLLSNSRSLSIFVGFCQHMLEKNPCLPHPPLHLPPSRLTAFVLKSFAQSRGFIFIDPEELRAAKSWLIKHQRDDGSFPAMGRILNKDLQVGLCPCGCGIWGLDEEQEYYDLSDLPSHKQWRSFCLLHPGCATCLAKCDIDEQGWSVGNTFNFYESKSCFCHIYEQGWCGGGIRPGRNTGTQEGNRTLGTQVSRK